MASPCDPTRRHYTRPPLIETIVDPMGALAPCLLRLAAADATLPLARFPVVVTRADRKSTEGREVAGALSLVSSVNCAVWWPQLGSGSGDHQLRRFVTYRSRPRFVTAVAGIPHERISILRAWGVIVRHVVDLGLDPTEDQAVGHVVLGKVNVAVAAAADAVVVVTPESHPELTGWVQRPEDLEVSSYMVFESHRWTSIGR